MEIPECLHTRPRAALGTRPQYLAVSPAAPSRGDAPGPEPPTESVHQPGRNFGMKNAHASACMHYISATPALLRKLAFLSKHSNMIRIAPTMLSTLNAQIEVPRFCDFTAGIQSSELLELARHGSSVAIENGVLRYNYSLRAGPLSVTTTREIKIHDVNYGIDIPTPRMSVKIKDLPILTKDNITLSVSNGVLVLQSSGFIKTRICLAVEKVDGEDCFSCNVRARDLKIVNEIEGERLLSFFDECIVAHGLESDATTAVLIRLFLG